jgi:hypothetical protein
MRDAGAPMLMRRGLPAHALRTVMPTWYFKSAERPPEHASHSWYWEIEADHTSIAITSSLFFETLEQCIAHAREHGFRGDVEVPESVAHPARIRCAEDDRRTRQRSSGRARRSTR